MKKNEDEGYEKRVNKFNGNKQRKKNLQRLGGRGLSLEAFANAKSLNNNYNPAIIKKQREFYKNAKCVNKYKRTLKQEGQQNNPSKSSWYRPEQQDNPSKSSWYQPEQQDIPSMDREPMKNEDETAEADNSNPRRKRMKKDSAHSLKELYEKKRQEEEKARMEREAIIQEKKEVRQRSEARRKDLKEKMLKKTKSGQPVMKYRIEHILETLQSSEN